MPVVNGVVGSILFRYGRPCRTGHFWLMPISVPSSRVATTVSTLYSPAATTDFEQAAAQLVTAGFDTEFPYVAWRYSFLDLPQVRISGSAGIDYVSLSASLQAKKVARE